MGLKASYKIVILLIIILEKHTWINYILKHLFELRLTKNKWEKMCKNEFTFFQKCFRVLTYIQNTYIHIMVK